MLEELKQIKRALEQCLKKGSKWHPCDQVVLDAQKAIDVTDRLMKRLESQKLVEEMAHGICEATAKRTYYSGSKCHDPKEFSQMLAKAAISAITGSK